MKHEFNDKAPLVRLAFAAAALSATALIGGFIDFLATGYSADAMHRAVVIANRTP